MTDNWKINWKLRWKNRATLAAVIAAVVSCVYTVLSALGVTPAVDESSVMAIVGTVLSLLTMLGVIVDPTTAGVGDSARAMGYAGPWDDAADDREQ